LPGHSDAPLLLRTRTTRCEQQDERGEGIFTSDYGGSGPGHAEVKYCGRARSTASNSRRFGDDLPGPSVRKVSPWFGEHPVRATQHQNDSTARGDGDLLPELVAAMVEVGLADVGVSGREKRGLGRVSYSFIALGVEGQRPGEVMGSSPISLAAIRHRRQSAIGGEVGECGAVSTGPPVSGKRGAMRARESNASGEGDPHVGADGQLSCARRRERPVDPPVSVT
jgi:hypothetical protein